MICDFPFQDDKINHTSSKKISPCLGIGSDKANLQIVNNLKCINTNGLLAMKNKINLDRDWIISFEYFKKDWSPADWSHIFSFGTHNNYGGDNFYYAITLETKTRDDYQIMIFTQKMQVMVIDIK